MKGLRRRGSSISAFFFLIMALGVVFLFAFVQSPRFAQWVKTQFVADFENRLKITADFDEFQVKIFPPSISAKNPRLKVNARAIERFALPEMELRADLLEARIHIPELISGNLRLHQVALESGQLKIAESWSSLQKRAELLPSPKSDRSDKKEQTNLRIWDTFRRSGFEGIKLENIQILFWPPESDRVTERFRIQIFDLSQWQGRGGLGFQGEVELAELDRIFPEVDLDRLHLEFKANPYLVEKLRLDASSRGSEVSIEARGKGNLTEWKTLNSLKGKFEVKGRPCAWDFWKGDCAGEGLVQGTFGGDTKNFPNGLSAVATADFNDLQIQTWKTSRLRGSVDWNPNGQELKISDLKIEFPVLERTALESGSGGTVTVAAAKLIGLFGPQPKVQADIDFQGTHLHSALGPLAPALQRLSGKLTGRLKFEGTLPIQDGDYGVWTATPALKIESFIFDNAEHRVKKNIGDVLRRDLVKLEGRIYSEGTAIVFDDGFTVGDSRIGFKLKGKISKSAGWIVDADGINDLTDLGQLVERSIGGKGPVRVEVRGKVAAPVLEFWPVLENAMFLGIKFGQLRGMVAYDIEKEELRFEGIEAQSGVTQYSGEGKMDVGKDGSPMAFDIEILQGEMEDINRILGPIVSDIPNYPKVWKGSTQGSVKIRGTSEELNIGATIVGRDWDLYGERFSGVKGKYSYIAGQSQIREVEMTKGRGKIFLDLSAEKNGQVGWSVTTQNLNLTDSDWIRKMEIPVRGEISMESVGQGTSQGVRSSSVIKLKDWNYRGRKALSSEVELTSLNGLMNLRGNIFGPSGQFEAEWGASTREKGSLQVALYDFDFSPVLALINHAALEDPEFEAKASIRLEAVFPNANPRDFQGKIDISQLKIGRDNSRLELKTPIRTSLFQGAFDLQPIRLESSAGMLEGELKYAPVGWSGGLHGMLPVAILDYILPFIHRPEGRFNLNLTAGGVDVLPEFSGEIQLEKGRLIVASLETPIENMTGSIVLRDSVFSFKNMQGTLGGAPFDLRGQMGLKLGASPNLDLETIFKNNRIRWKPFQYVALNGRMSLKGKQAPWRVSGDLSVPSALMTESFGSSRGVRTGAGVSVIDRFAPKPEDGDKSSAKVFDLNLDLHSPSKFWVRNEIIDGEFRGDVKISGTMDSPQLVGSGEVVQGRMFFKDRVFQLEGGKLNFDQPSSYMPRFNISAKTEVSNTRVRLIAYGVPDAWKVDLSSTPNLPQSEILSLLTLGFTSDEVGRSRAVDRTAVQQGEAASLLLQSLDFNREVQETTGFEIGMGEAIDQQQGVSAFRPALQSGNVASPKILLKRKLGSKVDLSFGSTVGVGSTTQREINAQYYFSPNTSLIGVWNNFEGSNAGSNAREYQSWGADFKLQKRF